MLVVLIILSAGLLGVIIYFAISPKSSKLLRLAALIALGLIGLSLVVAGIFIIRGPGDEPGDIPLPFMVDEQPQKKGSNLFDILIFLVVFLAVMGLLIFSALRGSKKKTQVAKKSEEASIFSDDDQLHLGEPEEEIDDSFEIDTKV